MCAGAQSCFLTLWLTQETVLPKHSLTLIAFQSCMTYFLLQNAKGDILRDVCPHNESQQGSKPKKSNAFLVFHRKFMSYRFGMTWFYDEPFEFSLFFTKTYWMISEDLHYSCLDSFYWALLFHTWQQVWKTATRIFFQTSPFGFHSQKESVPFYIQSNSGTFSGSIQLFMRQYCKSAIIFLKHARVT